MKRKADRVSIRILHIEVLLGLVLAVGVFLTAAHLDMEAAHQMMMTTAQYVKEQCNRYDRIDLADETKSLMRVIQSAEQIAHELEKDAAGGGLRTPEVYARQAYVSGLMLMDETGKLVEAYHEADGGPERLSEYLDSTSLLDVAAYPEKRYATRYICEDGSTVDLAAVGRRDAPGIVAVYYHTSAEYIRSFSLSVSSMLSGYGTETNGTIVVSDGNAIIASNDETLIGRSTDELFILRRIKEAPASDVLVHTNRTKDDWTQYFGLMERGRNVYVYVYSSERDVFDSTLHVLRADCVCRRSGGDSGDPLADGAELPGKGVSGSGAVRGETAQRKRRAERRRGTGGQGQRRENQLSFPHEPRHPNAAQRHHRPDRHRRRAPRRSGAHHRQPRQDEDCGESSAQPD